MNTVLDICDTEFSIYTIFRGYKIELQGLIGEGQDDWEIPELKTTGCCASLYVYDPKENWANVWCLVHFIGKAKIAPVYTPNLGTIEVCDIEKNKQSAYREMLESWLVDPEFIEVINELARESAEAINTHLLERDI